MVKEIPLADSYRALARTKEDLLVEARSAVHNRKKVPKHLNENTVILSSVARTTDLMILRIIAVVQEGSIPDTLFNCLDTDVELKYQTIATSALIFSVIFSPLKRPTNRILLLMAVLNLRFLIFRNLHHSYLDKCKI